MIVLRVDVEDGTFPSPVKVFKVFELKHLGPDLVWDQGVAGWSNSLYRGGFFGPGFVN